MTSIIAASWHDDLSSRGGLPRGRGYYAGRQGPVPRSRRQVSDHRHPNTRRIFCVPSVLHGCAAIPFPKRADRQSIVSAWLPARAAKHQNHPCRTSEREAESVSLLLAIIDPRYPRDAELGATATGWLAATKMPLPAIELPGRLRAAQRRNGMRRRSEGASAHCPSCRCGLLQARRQRHRVS
jgi:hypothetical protein